jgi:hypothetical protein
MKYFKHTHGYMRLPAHCQAVQTLKYGENDVLGTPKYIFEESERNPNTNEKQNIYSKS